MLENELLWESADENIATVDSEGNVTGINYGETDITAKYHNNEWSCHIAVNNIIPIEKNTLEVIIEQGFDLNKDNKLSTTEASEIKKLDFGGLWYVDPKFFTYLSFFQNIEYIRAVCETEKDGDIIIQNLEKLEFLDLNTNNDFDRDYYETIKNQPEGHNWEKRLDNYKDYSIIISNLPSLKSLILYTDSKFELNDLPNLNELTLNLFEHQDNISENNISEISNFPNLTTLYICFNHYKTIDLSDLNNEVKYNITYWNRKEFEEVIIDTNM